MRPLSVLLATALLTTALTGCESADVAPNPERLVFGRYFGECRGEGCIEIFQLDRTTQTLAEDTTDHYPATAAPYDGRYRPLSAAQYQLVQDLAQLVPTELLTQPVGVVGQPDAADGGGYYLELTDQGQRKFWLIDTQKQYVPTYLHPFLDALDTRIQRLQ